MLRGNISLLSCLPCKNLITKGTFTILKKFQQIRFAFLLLALDEMSFHFNLEIDQGITDTNQLTHRTENIILKTSLIHTLIASQELLSSFRQFP